MVFESICHAFGDSNVSQSDCVIFAGKADKGDYQCNAALSMAKRLGMKPLDIAQRISTSLTTPEIASKHHSIIDSVTISGPGFLNLQLSLPFLQAKLQNKLLDPQRVGIPRTNSPQRVVVDYSSPNIAKEMHVGHLRSTIIGDSISRLLQFLGHDVLQLNHVGDWGTQFGMLIAFMKEQQDSEKEVALGDLVVFYKLAKQRFDQDPVFKDTARAEVVRLQAGDEDSLRAWQTICQKSRVEFQEVYDLLGVKGLQERGESFYNPMLPALVASLRDSGVAVESEGALCVFLNSSTSNAAAVDGSRFKTEDGQPLPLMVQKSDGGFLYGTTDLAALTHRIQTERAARIIYVTDAGQAQHFEMVFCAADVAGLLPKGPKGEPLVQLTHVPFGLVLGEDGKKIKSRSGDSVRLRELISEAVRIAGDELRARSNSTVDGLTAAEEEALLEQKARVVGIGSIKYADLSMNRESGYRFSFKKMLALAGNTAPYMLYAYARIEGIRRKAKQALDSDEDGVGSGEETAGFADLQQEKEELALAKHLIRFEEVLGEVERDLYPNKICDYLFELSQKFNQFYEHCPVLKASTAEKRRDRAALCTLTSETLKLGLSLLGIDTLDRL
eukprot:CAMPEP_0170075852 /NCGR_PEP_ID=MMETSP0019_2-20121128/12922_1 /TAXON_ID=98059 /ORGANISM="Dinobryon sp., Strain UTEXLB2267" /LENGTH=612 /DNA_ID=CAMNT_0010287101 /DNA_START=230 /DNA_END=2068 /DNA_ORIENTATION=+